MTIPQQFNLKIPLNNRMISDLGWCTQLILRPTQKMKMCANIAERCVQLEQNSRNILKCTQEKGTLSVIGQTVPRLSNSGATSKGTRGHTLVRNHISARNQDALKPSAISPHSINTSWSTQGRNHISVSNVAKLLLEKATSKSTRRLTRVKNHINASNVAKLLLKRSNSNNTRLHTVVRNHTDAA